MASLLGLTEGLSHATLFPHLMLEINVETDLLEGPNTCVQLAHQHHAFEPCQVHDSEKRL